MNERLSTARIVLAFAAALLVALPAGAADRWWGGANLGASFGGDVDYVSLEPVLGYWVNDKLTVGGRGILRYRKDDRFDGSSRSDAGVATFARWFPARRFFVQGEFEWISFEFPVPPSGTDRDGYSSLWAGGGYAQPITRHSWFSVVALYNLTWDEDDRSPYDDPWVVRGGIGYRF